MSWINKNRLWIRIIILILLALSLTGPWMFEYLYVPAEYSCGNSFIRLRGDFCGSLLSGVQFFKWFTGGFMAMLVDLVRGEFTGQAQEFLAALSLLPLLPFASTWLALWKKDSRHAQLVNLVAWSLAGMLTLTMFVLQLKDQPVRLWGLWTYIGLASSALIVEARLLRANSSFPINPGLYN